MVAGRTSLGGSLERALEVCFSEDRVHKTDLGH